MSDDPDGTWPDNLITFSEDGWPEVGLSGEPLFERYVLGARFFSLSALSVFLLVLAVALPFTLLLSALSTGRSEFEIAVLIELSSGAAMFALLPFVLKLSLIRPGLTYASLLVLLLSCATAGYFSSGTPRSLFVEACGGLLTILVLDLGYRSFVADLEGAVQKAWKDKLRFEQEWDE